MKQKSYRKDCSLFSNLSLFTANKYTKRCKDAKKKTYTSFRVEILHFEIVASSAINKNRSSTYP